jgi:hypothetical protein
LRENNWIGFKIETRHKGTLTRGGGGETAWYPQSLFSYFIERKAMRKCNLLEHKYLNKKYGTETGRKKWKRRKRKSVALCKLQINL